MERVFGTLQPRLSAELRLNGITSIQAANRFLVERFIADHNHRFAVAAAEPGSAFVPFAGSLADILCVQEDRVVGHDNTVRYDGLILQIPEQRHRHHFVKAKVRVHRYETGDLAIFHGPRRLARYHPDGTLREDEPATQSAAKPARRPPCGVVDNAARSPQPHRGNNNRSGHLMCYKNRTSSKAIDTPGIAGVRSSTCTVTPN
jgi:hypothetical protein